MTLTIHKNYKNYSKMLTTLANMNRYNGSPKLHNQSVAEHSFNVVVLASLFCKINSFSRELRSAVVDAAMSHDMAESILSDIPHDAKKSIEKLTGCEISQFEKDVMQQSLSYFYEDFCRSEGFSSGLRDAYKEDPELSTNGVLISLICKYCDTLDVLIYLDIEEKLGNDFHIKREDVIERLVSCKEQIRKLNKYMKFIEEEA